MKHLSITLDLLQENRNLITTRDQIDTIVNAMFPVKNDQMMLKAFLYRKVLNYTPRQAGRELGLSRIKLNMLIQTIPHRRLNSTEFNNQYVRIVDACENYSMYFQEKEHMLHLKNVKSRLDVHFKTIA